MFEARSFIVSSLSLESQEASCTVDGKEVIVLSSFCLALEDQFFTTKQCTLYISFASDA